MPEVFVIILASTTSAVAALTAYYSFFVSGKPKVYVENSELKNFLETGVKVLQEKYSPSPLFWEGRIQTILGQSINRITNPKKFPYKRELFRLSDGGEIALDFAEVEKPADGKCLRVLLFPGLTSSSQSAYVRTLVTTLNESRASVIVFNNRGIGGVPFKTARTYSASNTDDTIEVVAHLRKRYQSERMIALGTSLGGMLLGKYLVTRPTEAAEIFESAILISVPWDCNEGIINMETDFLNFHLINKGFTQSMVAVAKKFLKTMEALEIPTKFNSKAVLNSKTVREFHTNWTVPEFGFESVVDYYNSATVKGLVHKFSIPVFALNAEDDPMCPRRCLPIDEAEAKGSKLALITTSHGGHLGFLEGIKKKQTHFTERFAGQLVTALRRHRRMI